MDQLTAALTLAIVSIVSAATSAIIAWIKSKKTKAETEDIETRILAIEKAITASDKPLYVICPHCGAKILLSKVEIFKE